MGVKVKKIDSHPFCSIKMGRGDEWSNTEVNLEHKPLIHYICNGKEQ